MAKLLVFSVVLILHWIVQFIAWSYAERSTPMRVLWKISATPLVHAGGSITNQYFWVVATANSVLWAAILTCVIARHALKH